jgi:hypothetical protein
MNNKHVKFAGTGLFILLAILFLILLGLVLFKHMPYYEAMKYILIIFIFGVLPSLYLHKFGSNELEKSKLVNVATIFIYLSLISLTPLILLYSLVVFGNPESMMGLGIAIVVGLIFLFAISTHLLGALFLLIHWFKTR